MPVRGLDGVVIKAISTGSGFVAQINLRPKHPKPQTQLCHGHRIRATQLGEPVENGGADVQLHDLPLKRPG